MNCRMFEPLIALYVEGDLPERDTARVDAHLAQCADCREILEDLRASQAAVKQLGSEAVDAALLSTVRTGVLSRIGEPGPWWRWTAGLAMTLALIAAFVMAHPKRVREPHPAPIAQAPLAPQTPSTEATPRAEAPTLVKRHVARARTSRSRIRQAGHRPAPPLVVKMLTDDPNIVIIWLVDQTGD
jgi:anti-sigma factor RsiW